MGGLLHEVDESNAAVYKQDFRHLIGGHQCAAGRRKRTCEEICKVPEY